MLALTVTVRERIFLSKGKIRAILSPHLAEYNFLTIQPIFMRFFVLIKRSCVLCLTVNFFVHRQSSSIFQHSFGMQVWSLA